MCTSPFAEVGDANVRLRNVRFIAVSLKIYSHMLPRHDYLFKTYANLHVIHRKLHKCKHDIQPLRHSTECDMAVLGQVGSPDPTTWHHRLPALLPTFPARRTQAEGRLTQHGASKIRMAGVTMAGRDNHFVFSVWIVDLSYFFLLKWVSICLPIVSSLYIWEKKNNDECRVSVHTDDVYFHLDKIVLLNVWNILLVFNLIVMKLQKR